MSNNIKITAWAVLISIILGIGYWTWGSRSQKDKEYTNSSASVEKRDEGHSVNLERYKNSNIQFRHPPMLKLSIENVQDTAGWSNRSTQKGDLVVAFKLDQSKYPKTNLSKAIFTVGKSKAPQSVSTCMKIPEAPMVKADSIRRAGSLFIKSEYSEAGAGNRYHIRQYRTLYEGTCYSIEEKVHSTNIHNYPSERDISKFDSTRVWSILDVAGQTFSFSQ